MHFGGIIVPPGYTDALKFVDGNPYGASLIAGHDNISEFDDATNDALDHLAKRVVASPTASPPSDLCTLSRGERGYGVHKSREVSD